MSTPSTDKRRSPRVRKRVAITFTEGTREHPASTSNLSYTGISVTSNMVLAPGAEVHGKILLPEGAVAFHAEVMWAHKARRALDEPNGMGFRFIGQLGATYEAYLASELARGVGDHTVRRTAPVTTPPVSEVATTQAVVAAADLALPVERGPSPLSLRRATELVKEGLAAAVNAFTPQGTFSIGLELDVAVALVAATPGAQVRVTARLTERTPARQQYAVTISDGQQTLASGRYVCRIIAG